jgi:hypothetical protein
VYYKQAFILCWDNNKCLFYYERWSGEEILKKIKKRNNSRVAEHGEKLQREASKQDVMRHCHTGLDLLHMKHELSRAN